MKPVLGVVAIASIPLGLAISGCRIGGPPPPAFGAGITSQQIAQCNIVPRVIQVIRVSIPDNLALETRHVDVPSTATTDDDDDGPVVPAPTSTISEFNTNPFHIDLTAFKPSPFKKGKRPTATLGGYYEVRVVLTGVKFVFDTTDKDASGATIDGVAYGTANATASSFCGANVVHLAGSLKPNGQPYKHAVAVFYVPYKPPSSAAPVAAGYNILIKDSAAQATPVIIDPKIENNG